jgi:hypothetical protein|eukprot:418_1
MAFVSTTSSPVPSIHTVTNQDSSGKLRRSSAMKPKFIPIIATEIQSEKGEAQTTSPSLSTSSLSSSSSSTLSAEEALFLDDNSCIDIECDYNTVSTNIINNNDINNNDINSDNTSKKEKKIKPRVTFGNIEIRRYNRILGDNPACIVGPPIQLDWTYNPDSILSVPIEEYENNRYPRRTRRQLVMTTITRRNMMTYHFGCTHEEVDAAERSTKKIQRQRAQTKTLKPCVERRQEITQSITRRMKRTLSREKLVFYDSSNTDRVVRKNHNMILAKENGNMNNLVMIR